VSTQNDLDPAVIGKLPEGISRRWFNHSA